ncbi:TalC/MipB family fructose-6-phosphate aldolase [Breznakia sp. PF5-3]|uniref:fructose-6-phosphate aldolase n=1 Tax=unclassified Breznakia TaxID=2623764 RepID=UPI002405CB98|nr:MULTISPECIES: fructose-6-phosphate aldolase [unclassified Breznakia]MDF9825280.1 TalC/MipB family fructose-6-phosphate aldolase [Breznakia sp. PM6-1]MDF9836174.1 TalC/MipB family fructose-6-phosphate aldolase [Breznakia sp. PF5-3]MDF9837380.1 TalC/MipB family fructose-6-phosphate aldolase [Breznakia sp. PFB2-8]MDF9859315.1 TalC/MipB family fructose-6-phosphate aldolase [Breznakia sp. PH5-24]
MKLLIDNANIEDIKRIYEYYPMDGVTCNPTILLKEGKNPYKILKEIREFIGSDAQLHVQVISLVAEEMVKEAHQIQKILGKHTFIKIPVIPEGLKAIKQLASEGVNVTGTAVYSPMQGYLAGKAGAKYVAPYVNRIDNLGYNGIAVAKQIHDMLKDTNIDCEVIAASFKNAQQVIELCEYGVGASTISADVVEGLIKNDTINAAVDVFVKDFETLCGTHATMLTCLDD